MRILPALLALSGALLASACAPRSAPMPSSPATLSGEERARVDSLRYPYTEDDISFMRGMIQHHAQAIKISRWAPTHGANPEVQRLAARIINAQNDDITLMQTWLGDRNRSFPRVSANGDVTLPDDMQDEHAGHEGHQMAGHEGMPGMLNAAQLAELDAARGETFDKTFLAFMIQHHRGAVSMVNELLASRGGGQDETIFKFASDVSVDQSTEIRRMLRMLIDAGGIPPE